MEFPLHFPCAVAEHGKRNWERCLGVAYDPIGAAANSRSRSASPPTGRKRAAVLATVKVRPNPVSTSPSTHVPMTTPHRVRPGCIPFAPPVGTSGIFYSAPSSDFLLLAAKGQHHALTLALDDRRAVGPG